MEIEINLGRFDTLYTTYFPTEEGSIWFYRIYLLSFILYSKEVCQVIRKIFPIDN